VSDLHAAKIIVATRGRTLWRQVWLHRVSPAVLVSAETSASLCPHREQRLGYAIATLGSAIGLGRKPFHAA
jgi:hypothetical protein